MSRLNRRRLLQYMTTLGATATMPAYQAAAASPRARSKCESAVTR